MNILKRIRTFRIEKNVGSIERDGRLAVMDWITHRPELATPVTGWKQLKELFQEGLDPYDSGSPLLLHLFSFIHSHPFSSPLAYGLVDCYSAWIFYLFSPLNVSTSLSKSTVVFNNLAVLLALDGALRSNRMAFSMLSLSMGTHLSVYPVLLVPSCIGIILDRRGSESIASTITKSLGSFIGHFLSLALFTPFSVLSTQLDVNKYLRPDVGLHWYLSIAMFNHFRLFVNVVFQIHLLIYILPMMINRIHRLEIPGFPTRNYYYSTQDCFHRSFYGPCLLPAFHQLWMSLGSGDANFYYASTLWIDAIPAILIRNFQIVDLDAKEIDKSHEVMLTK
ncbi:hypothetical protein PSTT_13546 [Puccinia striiformis]|uniref:GPI transamidase subunit PIG-U n=1 Tax=Puccinia striiformis TaxID=27350 RepID=A0A2S4UQZ7_9BASI|nr:hypothetical protein PSTT_13546 [Puccinia striiformis]